MVFGLQRTRVLFISLVKSLYKITQLTKQNNRFRIPFLTGLLCFWMVQISSFRRIQSTGFKDWLLKMLKNRPLVKLFRTSSTIGYIMYIMGLYLANGGNNASSIITHIIKSNCGNFMDFMNDHNICWSRYLQRTVLS